MDNLLTLVSLVLLYIVYRLTSRWVESETRVEKWQRETSEKLNQKGGRG